MSTRDDDALLEIQTVRRRQLATAALHGSTRSWMTTRRRWPAAIAGLLVAGVLLLGVGITSVVRAELGRNKAAATPPPTQSSTPTPTATPSRSSTPSRTTTPRPTTSTSRPA